MTTNLEPPPLWTHSPIEASSRCLSLSVTHSTHKAHNEHTVSLCHTQSHSISTHSDTTHGAAVPHTAHAVHTVSHIVTHTHQPDTQSHSHTVTQTQSDAVTQSLTTPPTHPHTHTDRHGRDRLACLARRHRNSHTGLVVQSHTDSGPNRPRARAVGIVGPDGPGPRPS